MSGPKLLAAADVLDYLGARYVEYVKAARDTRGDGDYARYNGHAEAYRLTAEHVCKLAFLPVVDMRSNAWRRANGLPS